MKFLHSILLAAALCLSGAGCDQKPAEPEAAAPPAPHAGSEAAKSAEVPADATAPSADSVETNSEPMPPEAVPGLYRDPAVPEVLYEFGEGDRWSATWETGDGGRGLMMEGMYQIEKGEVLHLLVMQFGRRGTGSLGSWDVRTPPPPRPRGYFRIEGNELVIVPGRTASAFTMSPFTAARLVKVAD